jgi:Tfp pilus assembly protein PilN
MKIENPMHARLEESMSLELTHLSSSDLPGLIGLNDPMRHAPESNPAEPMSHLEPQPAPGQIAYATAELRDLRSEVDRLRAERDTLLDRQRQVMDLLGTRAPERLLHDLRNLLNERELFKALADLSEE